MKKCRFIAKSEKATGQLGKNLGELINPGIVIALKGELGSGKSVFARGIARSLNILGYIPSPTFTILQIYEQGKFPFYHFDWYRIADEEELYYIDAYEYINSEKGVTVIEWPDIALDMLPKDYLLVDIHKTKDQSTREIVISHVGKSQHIDLRKLKTGDGLYCSC